MVSSSVAFSNSVPLIRLFKFVKSFPNFHKIVVILYLASAVSVRIRRQSIWFKIDLIFITMQQLVKVSTEVALAEEAVD